MCIVMLCCMALRATASISYSVRFVLQAHARRSHASPLLRTLHGCHVQQRIEYKVALLTFKVRNTSTPAYLRRLNFRIDNTAITCNRPPRRRQPSTMTFTKRAFRCLVPAVWNSLHMPKTVIVLNSDYRYMLQFF